MDGVISSVGGDVVSRLSSLLGIAGVAVFPEYTSEEEEKVRTAKLVEVVKALYEVAPKLFTGQNPDQNKVFVGLLDILLETTGGEGIFTIIEGVFDLDEGEREDLAKLMQLVLLVPTLWRLGDLAIRKVFSGSQEFVFNER